MHAVRRKLAIGVLAAAAAIGCYSAPALAQTEKTLEQRVEDLEWNIKNTANLGILTLLTASFCALWAQNTGRSPWLWFFGGLFFSIIPVLMLLYYNAQDLKKARAAQAQVG
jgi:hypothetical protein